MHRIDTDGSVAGKFTDGNPAVGQEGTIADSAWLNDLQETIANVIEHAGIALVKGESDQLTQAIIDIATGVAGAGSGPGSVPTTRQVLGGGLVTGGGALALDLTLTVPKATGADVQAGLRDDAAVTPASLAAAYATVLGENGQMVHPGGCIEKWGVVNGNFAEGQQAVVFPTAFPNSCDNVQITVINATASQQRDIWPQRVSRTKTGFIAFLNYVQAGGIASCDGFEWRALGH